MEDIVHRALESKFEHERQWKVVINNNSFFLDFAIFCKRGKINVECDGDTFHSEREDIDRDENRDYFLRKIGWEILRFRTSEIINEPAKVIAMISEKVKTLNEK